MSTQAGLLQAIQEEPDDDGLRLIFADWLDDHGDPERAEFIRLQIDAARTDDAGPLLVHAAELLAHNGQAWAEGYQALLPEDGFSLRRAELATQDGICFGGLWFRRGFVDEVELWRPERALRLGPADIEAVGPLPTLRLMLGSSPGKGLEDTVGALASVPVLDRFRDVMLCAGFGGANEDGLHLLAGEPRLLGRLAGLWLSDENIGDAAVLAILTSPALGQFRELTIDGTHCTSAVIDYLVRTDRFRGMTYLHLGYIVEGGRGLRPFAAPGRWPRLRWLSLPSCGLDNLSLRGLMRPGAFPVLESLNLSCNEIPLAAIRAFLLSGAAPRLRKLGIGGTPLALEEVAALRAEFGPRVEIGYPIPRALWERAAALGLPTG